MSHSRVQTTRQIATLVILGCSLVACGQKGKLYLPNQKRQVPPATQSESPPQPDTQAQPQPLQPPTP